MMRALRQMGSGILYGMVSVMLVVGGLSLALAESYTAPQPTAAASLPAVPQTLTPTRVGPSAAPSSTAPPSATPTPPASCLPPAGWTLITVQPYDTLESLAAHFGLAPYQLAQANCLLTDNLVPGFSLYVPALPAATAIPCGAPYGWVHTHVIQRGETLYQIAIDYGTTVAGLQRANCLFSTVLSPGNLLWVPNLPPSTPTVIVILVFGTVTPSATPLPTSTSTAAPTAAPAASPAAEVPSPTITAFPTATP